jgi:hypothetical protein
MSAAPADGAEGADGAAKPKGKGKLLMIIGLVVVLAGGGGAV